MNFCLQTQRCTADLGLFIYDLQVNPRRLSEKTNKHHIIEYLKQTTIARTFTWTMSTTNDRGGLEWFGCHMLSSAPLVFGCDGSISIKSVTTAEKMHRDLEPSDIF